MQLWHWHGSLDAHLDRAGKLRGTRTHLRPDQLAGLEELLDRDSVAVESEEVPLAQRNLLGASSRIERFTPDELLARMSTAFDEVKMVVAAFSDAWDLEPRVRAASALLVETSELAARLGDVEPTGLEEDRRRLADLRDELQNDPLAVSLQDVERIEASLRSIRTDVDELAEFRSTIDEYLRRGVEVLGALMRAQQECETAHREVSVKIAAAAVPEPLALRPDVRAQLEHVTELAEAGEWSEAHRALDEWSARAAALLDEATRIGIENRAPIEERNRLRGLLDAYRAKALKRGLIEDRDLYCMFARAQDALYTAPTNLEDAAKLMRLCQQRLLGDHHEGGERS
jgi:hypothetical protein